MRRVCCVSIDVDPLPCYYGIHALGPPPDALREVVMQRCVPRFGELFARRGIEATFFVVAEDVDVRARGDAARQARSVVSELASAGHEIASHSYSHPYELARLDRQTVASELGRAHDVLGDVVGAPARGFRAPGYDISPAMIDELCALGYVYDSSILPAPAYYAAKAAVMAVMAVRGRPSGAVMTNPWALLAPPVPYRPSPRAPWRRGDAGIVELPIAVTPISRVPAIGTSLLLAPRVLRHHWVDAMRRRPVFNFELHAIDLADAHGDGIPAELVARQPDLRVPLADKLAALDDVLDRIDAGFDVVTLEAAASELAPTL